MNAYELADKLQELDAKLHLIDLFKSAVTLRQQADRIAELENAKQFIQNFAEEQHRRACALEEFQTKPLSEDEIYEIWCESNPTEYLPEVRLKDGSLISEFVDFVRSIEERHGIK